MMQRRSVLMILLSGLASASAYSVANTARAPVVTVRTRSSGCSARGPASSELRMVSASSHGTPAASTPAAEQRLGLRSRAAKGLANFVSAQPLVGQESTLKNIVLSNIVLPFDLSASSAKVRTADRLW